MGRRGEADRALRVAASAGEPARAPAAAAMPGPARTERHAGAAGAGGPLAALYRAHYRPLVRLAVLLAGDRVTAEEVVQEAFAAMDAITCREWDTGRALSCLRACVVVRSRSAVRRRVVTRTGATPAPDLPIAGLGELALLDGSAIVAAIRLLPDLQREVVALRCYCDLSDAQIAATLRISARAVRRHASHAMAALRPVLERES